MTTNPIPKAVSAPLPDAGRPRRRPEIDFFRGGFLMLMVIYHNFRVSFTEDPFQMALMSWLELGSTVFLVISGVNVVNFINSAARDPNFNATRFYLKSSFWLFIMGYSYNLIVGTPPLMDILQCVAIGTFLAYVLLHYKIPNVLVGIITLLIFGTGIVGFGRALTLSPDVNNHFLFNFLIANGSVTGKGVHSLFPTQWLFNLFGPIPWAGYFSLGIFLDRLKGKWVWIAAIVAVGMGVAGAYLPPFNAEGGLAFSFRANPRYIFQSISLCTVWFFLFKAYYRNKTHCNRTLAFWSETSLIIFVFHWFYIIGGSTLLIILAKVNGSIIFMAGFHYTRAILVFALMAATLRPLENWRRRLAKDPQFIKRMRIMMIVGFILAGIGSKNAHGPLIFLAAVSGKVMAAGAFAFSYPSFRAKWRKETVKNKKKTIKPTTVAVTKKG